AVPLPGRERQQDMKNSRRKRLIELFRCTICHAYIRYGYSAEPASYVNSQPAPFSRPAFRRASAQESCKVSEDDDRFGPEADVRPDWVQDGETRRQNASTSLTSEQTASTTIDNR